jgi:hypothetical protein
MSSIDHPDIAATTSETDTPKRTRADIARENAQHSTGPRTPEGKARAAQNSTRHGLYAKSNLIRGENADAFQKLSSSFFDDLVPTGSIECELVNDMADAAWRKRRYRRIEAEIFESAFAARDARDGEPGDIDGLLDGVAGSQLRLANRFGARAARDFRTALKDFSALRRDRDSSAARAANRAYKGHEGVTDSWEREHPMTHTNLMKAYVAVHPDTYFTPTEVDFGDGTEIDDSAATAPNDETKPAELATTRFSEPVDPPADGDGLAVAS